VQIAIIAGRENREEREGLVSHGERMTGERDAIQKGGEIIPVI